MWKKKDEKIIIIMKMEMVLCVCMWRVTNDNDTHTYIYYIYIKVVRCLFLLRRRGSNVGNERVALFLRLDDAGLVAHARRHVYAVRFQDHDGFRNEFSGVNPPAKIHPFREQPLDFLSSPTRIFPRSGVDAVNQDVIHRFPWSIHPIYRRPPPFLPG